MPKRTNKESPAFQASFFAIVDGPPTLVEPDEPLPPMQVFDPEANLARVHEAMQKRHHPDPIVDGDIQREVEAQRQALLKLWGVPTDAERSAELRESFEEAVFFLQTLPFRGTNAMDYLMNNELSHDDREDLRALLAGQYQVFADLSSSEGVNWYGTEAAFLRDRATQPKTPRRFRVTQQSTPQ